MHARKQKVSSIRLMQEYELHIKKLESIIKLQQQKIRVLEKAKSTSDDLLEKMDDNLFGEENEE